ncbi:hypothetical protein LB514_15835, partial [Mesorhizobium sp. CA17]|nr:hypothetical protein [Mesorhizobium sp. CA17]
MAAEKNPRRETDPRAAPNTEPEIVGRQSEVNSQERSHDALLVASIALRAIENEDFGKDIRAADAARLKEVGIKSLSVAEFQSALNEMLTTIRRIEMASVQSAGTSASQPSPGLQSGATTFTAGTVFTGGGATIGTIATQGSIGAAGGSSSQLSGATTFTAGTAFTGGGGSTTGTIGTQ